MEQHEAMLKLVEEKPDVTSEKMQAQLDLPIKNRRLVICFTRRVSLKKMLYVREQDREDVATRREEWAAQQPLLKPSKLVDVRQARKVRHKLKDISSHWWMRMTGWR